MVLSCIISLTGHTFDLTWMEMSWFVHHPGNFKISSYILFSCSAANVGMNTVIAYEVFMLVQNSNQRRRSGPPSLRKVLLQATGVYLYAIIFGTRFALILHYHPNTRWLIPIFMGIAVGIPFLVLLCIYMWSYLEAPSCDKYGSTTSQSPGHILPPHYYMFCSYLGSCIYHVYCFVYVWYNSSTYWIGFKFCMEIGTGLCCWDPLTFDTSNSIDVFGTDETR